MSVRGEGAVVSGLGWLVIPGPLPVRLVFCRPPTPSRPPISGPSSTQTLEYERTSAPAPTLTRSVANPGYGPAGGGPGPTCESGGNAIGLLLDLQGGHHAPAHMVRSITGLGSWVPASPSSSPRWPPVSGSFVLRSPGTQVDLRQALAALSARPTGHPGRPGAGSRLPASRRLQPTGPRGTSGSVSPVDQSFLPLLLRGGRHLRGVCHRALGAVRAAHGRTLWSARAGTEPSGWSPPSLTRRSPGSAPPRSSTVRAGAYFMPAHRRPRRKRWSATCHAGEPGGWSSGGRVLGWSTYRRPTVAPRAGPAHPPHPPPSRGGRSHGSNPTDYWVSPTSGTDPEESRRRRTSPSGPDPSDRSCYQEQMAITLTSLSGVR